MDLRAKLVTVLLVLLVLPFIAVTTLEIDRTMGVMVDNLSDSGDLLINQGFEQIRSALAHPSADPIATLRQDERLHDLLRSSQAFSKGVIYVRIEEPDGKLIVGEPADAPAANAPPFSQLRDALASWWPPTKFHSLWGQRTFEMSRVININERPAALIKVGLSTALISSEARHAVIGIAAAGAAGVLLAILGGFVLGGLLLEPIGALIAGVDQIAAGRDEVKVSVEGRDELSTLAEKFNQLARRIKASRTEWETERGQFFNIFHSITDAVILLDSVGGVLFANAEAQGRLGLPADGLAEGKPLRLLVGDSSPLIRMIDTARATGTEVRDIALELGDGSGPTRVLVSIFTLGQGPEPAGMLLVVRDLESVKQLEDVVNYSGRLVRLGGLISGVAHQLRNPLNAMNLQLELLGQEAERGAPVGPQIKAVRREIQRLDRAVDALMRFMRPQELELTSVPLNELLREVASQVANRPGIDIEYQLDPQLGSIGADRALLAEALRNVIYNAVEAMQQNGGTLKLSTNLSRLAFAEIAVADLGPGIPERNLPRIFDLYFTTKKDGTGLGLPLAYRAVDLHNGTMDVQSEVGVGTTIKIRLPLSRDFQQAAAPHVLSK